jgi:hypothetical protein
MGGFGQGELKMRPLTVSCVMLGVIVWLSGCAQGPAKEETPAPGFTPAAAGATVSPTGSLLGASGAVVYKAMGEDAATLWITREADSAGRQWTLTKVIEMAGRPPTERTVTMVRLEDGSLAISREVNRAEKVIVEFDPPLVVYPVKLTAGEPFEQKLRMIVHPINDATKVQNQGDAKQTIRYEGTERIQTPLGMLDTIKTVATLEADLGGPQVVNETQEWLAKGIGVVAIKEMERTTLFGVRVRANNEWWVVDSLGKLGP